MKSTCHCEVTTKQCFIVNYAKNYALIKFKESGLIFYGSIEKKSLKKGLLINYKDNVIYEGGFNEKAKKEDDNCCLMEFDNGRLFYGKCKEDILIQGKMLVINKKSLENERVVVNEMFEFERKGEDIKFIDEGKMAEMSDNYYEKVAIYGVKKLRRFQKVIKARKEVEKMIKKYENNSKWNEEEMEGDLKRIEDLFKEDKFEFDVWKKTKIDEGLMENIGKENKVSDMESKSEEVSECNGDELNKDKGIVTSDEPKQQIVIEENKDKFIQNEPGSEKQKETVFPIKDKETGKDILTDVKEKIIEPKDNETEQQKKEDKIEDNKEPEIKENKDDQSKYVNEDKKDKDDDITLKTEEEIKEKIIPSSNEKEEINSLPSEGEITNKDKEDNIPLNEISPKETITTQIEQKETALNENKEEQIQSEESKEQANKVEDNNIHIESSLETDKDDTQPQIENKIKESKDITEQEINNPEIEPTKDKIEQSVPLTKDKPITTEDKKEESIINDPTKKSNDEIVEDKDSQLDKGKENTPLIEDKQLSNETQNEQIENKTTTSKEIIEDNSNIQAQNKEVVPTTQEEIQGDNIIDSNKPKEETIPIIQKEEEKKQQENILPDISKDTSQVDQSDIKPKELKENEEIIESTPTKTLIEE